MAIPLTFLEAANGQALAKTFTPSDTIPYPRVKKLNSHTHYVSPNLDGLTEAYELFRDHANAGHSFLKGMLRKPLEAESRSGQTDKYALTQTLVIDIDSLPMDGLPEAPFTAEAVRGVAKRVQKYLPEVLQDTACIAHAGSSFGRTSDKVSMHLIYLIKRPVGPEGLKEWLINLNFADDRIEALLDLTPQNMSIKYVIDPVLAQNTHTLFIAKPNFQETDNPFTDDNDRWVLIDSGPATVDIIPQLSEVCPQANKELVDKKLTALRRAKGLSKFNPKLRTVKGMTGEKVRVISNPDAMRVEYAYENDEFVYFNVNGGDSNAYYCPKHNPDIIYNFKNEPPFELSKANPAVYEWYVDKYAEVIRERSDTLPVVFRDFSTDKHYAVLVDSANDAIDRMAEIQKTNIDDWMAEQGRSVPDPIPTWDIRFDPHSDIVFDPHQKSLNRFQLSPLLRDPLPILEQYQVTLGEASSALPHLCPSIHKILYHISGSSDAEYEYFLNWLAASIQLRNKLSTAWVFSGVPGTGKGIFYDHILRPMIGEQYARKKRIDHLDDKFDSHMAETLFTVYDEFRLSDVKDHGKTLNKIKDEIAAETGEVRAMRQESVTRRLYSNYLFFSNHNDAIRIEEGDRRFNIAPSQNTKLLDKYPELRDRINHLDDELPQFASFLMHYTVDEQSARTCLENSAKERMKESAMGWHEQFCLAIRQGDLDYFLDDISDDFTSTEVSEVFVQNTAKKIVAMWAKDCLNREQTMVPIGNLFSVYTAFAPQSTTRKKFATLLGRNDVEIQRVRIDGQRDRAIVTHFFSKYRTDEDLQTLVDHYHNAPTGGPGCQPTVH